jgi:aminopeptidase N
VEGNLTRDEARERARLVTVESYRVELDLTRGAEWFGTTTTIRFRCGEPGASTFADLLGARVREITLNGGPLVGAYENGRIQLPDLAAHNELVVTADGRYSTSGEGLHRFVDPVDGNVYLYSYFAVANAQRVYACFDQPDLKATWQLTVTAPAGWQVVANTASDPEPAGDVTRWRFPPTPPLPTYVTAVVAGPYHVVRDEVAATDGRMVPLGVYCRASLAEFLDAPEIIDITRRGFEFYQELFGMPYPFGKYDQLLVPEFNMGAMENAGCVTLKEEYVFRSRATGALRERRSETILHELAHMWFGNLVTMSWWDDLWLNESFATFAGLLCQAEKTRWTGSWTTFANHWKAGAYRQDQLPSTHPISADITDVKATEVSFDGITYLKGASVVKQLVAYVGRDLFFAGVRRYFRRHAWGNTTLTDLLRALEEESGRDLSAWAEEWLRTAGPNVLRADAETDDAGRFTAFSVAQEAPEDHPTLRTHRLAIGLYDRTGAGLRRRRRVEVDVTGDRTLVPELVGDRRPDLVLVNDDDLTYAKIRLDPHSLRTMLTDVGDIAEPLPRALCWTVAWDMTRDADLSTREYVRLVLAGLRTETNSTVAQTLLDQARHAVRHYADPAWSATGLSLLADGAYTLLLAAEPASDPQLVYAHAFIDTAVSPEHIATLARLLDGRRHLTGLTVDASLRWRLVRRLVVLGAVAATRIDHELTRDATAEGQRNAAACHAAVPTVEAKAAAWRRIVSGTLPNAVFRATMDGFREPDHRELLLPYAKEYFAEIGRVWTQWPADMALRFAVDAYPSAAASADIVELTDTYLSTAHPQPPLHRLLLENRADVVRAIQTRQRDRDSAELTAS